MGRRLWVVLTTVLVAGVLPGSAGRAAPGNAPLAEYEERSAKLAKDLAAEHFALGQWCKTQKLLHQAWEHFREALRFQPDHEGANAEMGSVAPKEVPAGRRAMCQLHLRDGLQVKAELLSEAFCVDTGSGVLLIPVDKTDIVKVGKGEAPDLVLADGFAGQARVEEDGFAAKAKVGVLNVKRENLDHIRIVRPCAVCTGTGMRQCPRCEGKGRLYETVECEGCGGTGKVQCDRCGGTGRLTCPGCGGQGWRPGAFAGFRFKCARCNGRGTIDCRNCKRGMMTCPDCKGKPVQEDKGPCPDCGGRKALPCDACKGTGIKPVTPDVEKEVTNLLDSTTNSQDEE